MPGRGFQHRARSTRLIRTTPGVTRLEVCPRWATASALQGGAGLPAAGVRSPPAALHGYFRLGNVITATLDDSGSASRGKPGRAQVASHRERWRSRPPARCRRQGVGGRMELGACARRLRIAVRAGEASRRRSQSATEAPRLVSTWFLDPAPGGVGLPRGLPRRERHQSPYRVAYDDHAGHKLAGAIGLDDRAARKW